MDRYFSCSSFYAFFLPEKESVGKKSRHKGGLRRDSLRSYSAQFPPLCIPPYDCSADSDSIGLYPKRSASVKPPVSKDLDARIPFKFFRSAKRVHPFLRYYYYIINFSVSIVRTLRVYSNIKKRNFYTLYFYTLYLLQLLDYTWFVLSHKTHYVY